MLKINNMNNNFRSAGNQSFVICLKIKSLCVVHVDKKKQQLAEEENLNQFQRIHEENQHIKGNFKRRLKVFKKFD